MYEYNAKILRVVDGDTIEVELDLGFHLKYKNVIRLARINADELRDVDPEKRSNAKKAKEYLTVLLPKDTSVVVLSKSLDKYGRILGEVLFNQLNVVDKLLEEKLVNLYGK